MILPAALLFVLFALSMDVGRLVGWWAFGALTVVGLLGAFVVSWALEQFRRRWNNLSTKRRVALASAAALITLCIVFATNHGHPDEVDRDLVAVCSLFAALLLRGLYLVFSRAIDAIYFHFSKR
ncbi:hypothetical protein [uncultured Paludibaculum sp.]|uniref:hypothetical protein n=1 Tax=uncultured Paludibaculum sp. TaxID=1765020 RepID=UPI002AAAB831|nr:hypothetical protein [uncultured Paludibaculum sp.]